MRPRLLDAMMRVARRRWDRWDNYFVLIILAACIDAWLLLPLGIGIAFFESARWAR